MRRALLSGRGLSCLYLPGAAGNYASVPDAVALDIVGDIDVRAAVALSVWTPAVASAVLSKWTGTGDQRSWNFRVEATTGLLRFQWSPDGTAGGVISADSTAAPTVSNRGLLLIRATLDADNGAAGNTVTFYTKPSTARNALAELRSGAGWTQLGDPVVTGTATSIFSSSAGVNFGAINAGATNPLAALVLGGVVLSGIAGSEVLVVDFTDPARARSLAVTGQVVTIGTSGGDRARIRAL